MIVTDEAQLRQVCTPVRDVREGGVIARKLTAALERINKKNLKAYRKNNGKHQLTRGIGLSAPQIGIAKHVAIVRVGAVPLILMNPVVVDASTNKISFTEGCLSFPGVEVETWRHIWVKVKCLNHPDILTLGPTTPVEWDDGTLLLKSVAAQHEIGHLFGLLMEDFTRQTQDAITQFVNETQEVLSI